MNDEDQYNLAPDPNEPDPVEEDAEPVHSIPSSTKAGAPLPRMWKADPEPEEEKPKIKAKKARASASASVSKAKKSVKGELAETPVLETYEGRTLVRMVIGAGAFGAVFLVGFLLFRSFTSGDGPVDLSEEEMIPEPPIATKTIAKGEDDARLLLTQAKQVAKTGKADQVVALLQKIVKAFPATLAAKEAKTALDCSAQGLPLFPEGAAVVATSPEATAPTPVDVPPSPVVNASPAPVTGAGTAEMVLPVNAAEPARTTPASSTTVDAALPANSKPLPAGFRPREGTLYHASGWPIQIVSDRDGATMIFIAGTTFPMGRDEGPLSESPSHPVSLSSYYMDQHEVTNRQYTLFLRETGRRAELVGSDDHPVVKVDAKGAKDYADWAGKKVPTEAQWELAARSPDGRVYPAGSEPPSWAKPRQPRQVDTVMSFENDQSPYGVFDLAGNVWEWTSDWFDAKYYQTLKGQTAVNPIGPASSRAKSPLITVKGGSKTWNTSWREGLAANSKLPYLGFRCVLPVEGSANQTTNPANPGGNSPPPNSSGVVPF